MKTPYVNELEPNKVILTSFLVHSKEIRQKKSGELYLSLLLGDRTGELDAKMWDNVAEVIDSFERDDFVKVKGLIQVFHNRPQLTIHKVRRMDDSEIDFVDYFPSSRRDADEMWKELQGIVGGIGNRHLKALLESLLNDEDVSRRFRRAPAAKQIHHAFLGGLIEHVLSLCALARVTAAHYPIIDLDLLLTGVVLHDIGKIYELNYERGFSYSNDGQLLGHINIGMRMVAERIHGLPDFPVPLRSLVEHMILSHHGQLEFGSPKLPQFPEALLLHYLDDMDSKMECMRAMIENDRQVEGCFTTFSPALTRAALKKDRYLNGEAPAVRQPAAPVNGTAGRTEKTDASRLPEKTDGPRPTPAPPPAAVPVVAAAHPLFAPNPVFAPKPDSAFADKLKQALQPAGPKQES
ncbi:MAG TPA: HD domain-containing protein [Bryobacteraceae bacterium]|jgi:3'-5' exoribonuclease